MDKKAFIPIILYFTKPPKGHIILFEVKYSNTNV